MASTTTGLGSGPAGRVPAPKATTTTTAATTTTTTTAPEWTYERLVNTYCDFLLTALHLLTFHRHLYDRHYYSLARAFGCPVHRCRHPLVAEYLGRVVAAVAEEVKRCTVSRITVVILSDTAGARVEEGKADGGRGTHRVRGGGVGDEVALERFVFDVSALPVVAPDDLRTPFKQSADGAQDTREGSGARGGEAAGAAAGGAGGFSPTALEGQFRAALMKLAMVETKLGPLPTDCTFSVNLELRKEAAGTIKNIAKWVEAEPVGTPEDGKARSKAAAEQMVPLRRIVFGPIKLDSWVEETRAKLKLPDRGAGNSIGSDERMDLSF